MGARVNKNSTVRRELAGIGDFKMRKCKRLLENGTGQFMKMNLQFFAEPEPQKEPNTTSEEGGKGGTEYTLDDVMGKFSVDDILSRPELAKGIQSKIDTTVTKALNTARSKWEQELEEEQDEAKKLEKMNAEQRARYQLNKEKTAFEVEKKKFEAEQMKVATGKELLKRGLDSSFADYLTGNNAEETVARIDKFEQAFNTAVANATNKQMKGKAPKDIQNPNGITMEQIKNMTPSEINANWEEVQKVLTASKK